MGWIEQRFLKLESLIRSLNARMITGDQAAPGTHATTHSPGGSDTLSGYYATTAQQLDHDARHSPGGADTLDVYYATTNSFNSHKARHAKGGADALDAFYAETKQALDTFGPTTDITTLNSTTSVHGLLPKLGGGTTNFLRADGTWAAPGGGSTVKSNVVIGGNGGDFTTTSTADTDITSATITFTTAASASHLICFTFQYAFDGIIAGEVSIDIAGAQDYSGHFEEPAANRIISGSLVYLKTGLAAASTTFKARCRTDSGTLTIKNSTAGSNRGNWALTVVEHT